MIDKALPGAPHEGDSGAGRQYQNALTQVKPLTLLGLTGLILTKLDGTARQGDCRHRPRAPGAAALLSAWAKGWTICAPSGARLYRRPV